MSPPSGLDSAGGSGDDLDAKIAEQGNKVRQLKADKKDKQEVDEAVKLLLEMKVCRTRTHGRQCCGSGSGSDDYCYCQLTVRTKNSQVPRL